ncbi:DUF748 domain-containing protein [Echinimonas agarilytica]|uniref:DUF748 domain-containing protein n=1 Tax=Echinimonas agarilytica TaxID=1215918 RepID=A0AA42B6M9_9GAMM|nr:DUF748 domain-containing protein [Echinimonas agarilytica]MCM2678686.1 DUF748 domain-containing protein [Echinimonas agarilytica]
MALNLGHRWRTLRTWQRRTAITFVVLVLYVLLTGVVLPKWVKWQLQEQLAAQTGRAVLVGETSFHPFKLALTVNQLKIQGQDPTQNFAGLNRIYIDFELWPLLIGDFDFKAIELDTPYLYAQRDHNGTFDFQDIVDHQAAQAELSLVQESNSADENASIPSINIGHFKVNQGLIHFEDHLFEQQDNGKIAIAEVTPLGFELFNFSTRNKSKSADANHYKINALLPSGGDLAWQGTLDVEQQNMTGDLVVRGINLAKLAPFVEPYVAFELERANLDIDTHYYLSWASAPMDVSVSEGVVTLYDFVISDPVQQQRPIQVGRFDIKGIALDLNPRQVNIEQIELADSQFIAAINTDGQIDLATLLQPNVTAHSENIAEDAPPQPWQWALKELRLTNINHAISESFSGSELSHSWVIDSFQLTGLESSFNQPLQLQISSQINDSAKLSVQGPTQVHFNAEEVAIKSALKLQLSTLDLSHFETFITPYLDVDLDQGLLNLDGDIALNLEAGRTQLTTNINAQIDDLNINAKDTELLSWQQLKLDAIELNLAQQDLKLEHIHLAKPFARVVIAEDRSTNIGDLVKSTPPADSPQSQPQASSESASKSWTIGIGGLSFDEGEAYFSDRSLTPKFTTAIHQIAGSVGQFSSEQTEPAKVHLEGTVDKYAPVTLDGRIQPLLENPFLDLTLDFKHIELTSLNPYSGTYAGYVIDKGQLSINLDYELDNNQLKGSNHVIVDQLELGRKTDSIDATSLPVALAVALMKDENGVIDLGLEVSGSADDPQFSIGALVAKALGNAIKKIITSPFALLGSLVGEGDQLDEVEFGSGIAKLSADNMQQLGKLAEALNSRPMLKLEILGRVSEEDDGKTIAQQTLLEHVNKRQNTGFTEFTLSSIKLSDEQRAAFDALTTTLPIEWKNQQRQQIAEQITEQTDDAERARQSELDARYYQALLTPYKVTNAQLTELALTRARAIKTYMVEQAKLDPARLFVLQPHIEKNSASRITVMTLKAD